MTGDAAAEPTPPAPVPAPPPAVPATLLLPAWSRVAVTLTAAVLAGMTAGAFGRGFPLAVAGALGAAVPAWLLWRRLVQTPRGISLGRAALFGVVVVFLAYPLIIMLVLLLAALGDLAEGRANISLADAVSAVVVAVPFAALIGTISTGWATYPIGILASVLVALVARRSARLSAARQTTDLSHG